MRNASKLQPGNLALFRLEGDGGGEEPSIELGQHHLHSVVRLRQAARRVLPGLAARTGDYHLQYRSAGGLEWRVPVVETRLEGGGVEHHAGSPIAQPLRN